MLDALIFLAARSLSMALTSNDPVATSTAALDSATSCLIFSRNLSAVAATPSADTQTWRELRAGWARWAEIGALLTACGRGFAVLAERPDEDVRRSLEIRVVAAREHLAREWPVSSSG